MANKKVSLWHVTHKENLEFIEVFGVDPAMAVTIIKRSWWVRWYGLMWAILHIAYKKGWNVQDMAVINIKADARNFTHFNRYIYTCKNVMFPAKILSAEIAFAKIENQRGFLRGGK